MYVVYAYMGHSASTAPERPGGMARSGAAERTVARDERTNVRQGEGEGRDPR